MLMRAASGLERLMYNKNASANIQDSNVAQISAALYYQANVIAKLNKSEEFKNKFKTILFNQINKDFGEYIDAQARIKPKSLHHVYEWKQVGNPSSRLFQLNSIEGAGISFKVNFEFLPSKTFVPNSFSTRKHIFVDKALIMENNTPVIITPKTSKRLVFEGQFGVVFMPPGASVTVKNPGGKAATRQFTLHYSRFFSGQLVNNSIKASGFQKIFNSDLAVAMKLPTSIKKVQYSFSPNVIRSQADEEVRKAFGGALI